MTDIQENENINNYQSDKKKHQGETDGFLNQKIDNVNPSTHKIIISQTDNVIYDQIPKKQSISIQIERHQSQMSHHKKIQLKTKRIKNKDIRNKSDINQKSNNKYSQLNSDRLKNVINRKQQLMQKLKKIDNQLYEARKQQVNTILNNSRLKEYNIITNKESPNQSPLKLKQSATYSIEKHSKAIQMLQKINIEKVKRQQKLMQNMRQKKQEQRKRIQSIQLLKILQLQEIEKKRNARIDNMFKKYPAYAIKIQKSISQLPQTINLNKQPKNKKNLNKISINQNHKSLRHLNQSQNTEIVNKSQLNQINENFNFSFNQITNKQAEKTFNSIEQNNPQNTNEFFTTVQSKVHQIDNQVKNSIENNNEILQMSKIAQQANKQQNLNTDIIIADQNLILLKRKQDENLKMIQNT